jgi:Flp pilus assembly protein CpaB
MRRWAVLLVAVAALGVITTGCQRAAPTTSVIVSNEDIPAGSHLDRLIARGVFHFIQVPDYALVAGTITAVDELRGQTTVATIYANEQIPTSRLDGIP